MKAQKIDVNEAIPLNHETYLQAKNRVIKFYGYYPFDLRKIKFISENYKGISLTTDSLNEIYNDIKESYLKNS